MVKNEQSNDINQSKRTTPIAPVISVPLPPPPPMFQTTTSAVLPQRLIDPNAIDITSLKGQFAWEKIHQSDTYVPVIFRGDTKYFCVRMLRKLLPDYPEDVIRRASHYQYGKTIDLYHVTSCEVELLNRINANHTRFAYSRQPFTALDEIVRVSNFLPFLEHLRHGFKPASALLNSTAHTLRQLLPQPQQTVQRSSDYTINMPTIIRAQSSIPQGTSVQIQSYPASTDFSRENILRPVAPATSLLHPSRQPKSGAHPFAVVLPTRPQYQLAQQQQQQKATVALSTNTANSANKVLSNNPSTVSIMTPVSIISSSGNSSASSSPAVPVSTNISSLSPVAPSSSAIINRKFSTSSSTSTTLTSKSSRLHCGWLQVNKLYTPYISTSATNHHLYKIPVSLLSFYDLIKSPSSSSLSSSSETNDSKDSILPFEQTLVTPQEIEMINELCVKQSIQPLASDTKLIQLSTFYQYFSANILFLKELPLNEPKSHICKEWSSIVQINGGICRLRNTTTLHEQTVPFIGNNLLKNFILSSQCLSAASLTKPTSAEHEFLQLILFFSNMSINLRNAQLIDIESVRKEYNVDLILLFNDKFPINVLNYQQQGNQTNTSQAQILPSNSTAPTNTIAESTPPPSPPSPPTNQPPPPSTSQLPLTPSSTNRYHKTIQFHGHSMIAYICSGLGSNCQRECVSIKSLCNILYPNSTFIDKLEMKMLRLLRSKNINRFRPQNQQSLGFTRLIDIKDAEKHWDYIEQGMRSIDNEEVNVRSSISSVSNESPKASTVESVEKDEQPPLEAPIEINKGEKRPLEASIEINEGEKRPLEAPIEINEGEKRPLEAPIEINKGEKRPLDEPLDEEDMPVLERINKRTRFTEKENNEQLAEISNHHLNSDKVNCDDNDKVHSTDDQLSNKIQSKRTIKLTSIKKRLAPSNRSNQQSKATWVRKYNIEDCCIRLDHYDTGKD